MKRLILVTSLALAACDYTAGDLRQEPMRFSMNVPVAWDRVATCVKAAYMDKYSVVDLPVADQRRTEVIVQQMATFDIRGTADGSVVEFRRRKIAAGEGAFEAQARQTVENCGKV